MFASAGVAATIGRAFLLVGFICSFFGLFASVVAWRDNDPKLVRLIPRFATLAFVGAFGAFATMEYAMITRDFSLNYVQKVGSWSTPALYNFAAVWSALEGSILLWVLILAGYSLAVSIWVRKKLQHALAVVGMAVMFAVLTFFFLVSFFPANPFALGAPGVLDGPGPNPLLQNHILVLFHPPILYLGYVGVTVPFAFAIAALVTGQVDDVWLASTRRWSLFAWGFLTFGIALGSWWSYEVLGWSGVWAWDPVENASLLPWITGTAYLHSVMVQFRRAMLRVWNISLLVATFSLTILGTFLTRSGVLNSVHAFSQSGIGGWFLSLFGVVVVISVGLIGWRGDKLRTRGIIDSAISREAAFLANNLVFALFAFVVLLGTVFPLVIEAVQDRQIAVGAPFFDRLSKPIGLAILTLMAIAPVLPWRKTSTETLRDRLFWPVWCGIGALVVSLACGAYGLTPLITFTLGGVSSGAALRQVVLATRHQGLFGLVGRANGGMIVHFGVILIAVGLGASNSYSKSHELDLLAHKPATFAGHTFELSDVVEVVNDASTSVKALIVVDGDKTYAPAITKYTRIGMTVGTPSVRTSLTSDIYLTLEPPVRQDSGTAKIKVFIKPLMMWLWIGAGLMMIGTLLAAFPGRRRNPTDPTSAPLQEASV